MKKTRVVILGLALAMLAGPFPASAFVQFPYDIDNQPYGWSTGGVKGVEDIDWNNNDVYNGPPLSGGVPVAKYMHVSAGDGFARMADDSDMYIFGFADLTGVPSQPLPPLNIGTLTEGMLKANFSAPTIDISEGQQFYLTLSNVGMVLRPDLFDPHTIHFHGYPNIASVFDGEPMSTFGIRMMQEITYFYSPYGPVHDTTIAAPNIVDPGAAGTYLYHCHQEATEHMEMGMLGNNLIRPVQDGTSHSFGGRTFTRFAYNDCLSATDPLCGSTGYDVEKLIQFTEFDPVFHEADMNAQPPPFAILETRYSMLNGRGYPDTVDFRNAADAPGDTRPALLNNSPDFTPANMGYQQFESQKLDARITAAQGQTILIRFSNLSIQNFTTIEAMGLRLKVIGMCARQLRNPGLDGIYGTADDKDLSYVSSSVFVGPGESIDFLIQTAGMATGTYFLYSRNLDQLNNNQMDRGGAMTEIIIN
jgi:FtsP/CotA-like multicopper oxidase with cupredoxin domain